MHSFGDGIDFGELRSLLERTEETKKGSFFQSGPALPIQPLMPIVRFFATFQKNCAQIQLDLVESCISRARAH